MSNHLFSIRRDGQRERFVTYRYDPSEETWNDEDIQFFEDWVAQQNPGTSVHYFGICEMAEAIELPKRR